MTAKAKVIPFQPPFVDSDDDDCDCPKCPPVGAPAWLATFADIATNLMAFFVLILGFAQFDEPSFEKFAGAMRDQFGFVAIRGPASGEGNTVIELHNAPNHDDSEFDQSAPGDGANAAPNDENAARAVAEALRDALAKGSLDVDAGAGTVTIRLPDVQGPEAALALADAIATAAGGKVARDEGAGQPQPGTTDATRLLPDTAENAAPAPAPTEPNPEVAEGVTEIRSRLAAIKLEHALSTEIEQGALTVEQRDGKVYVTLGAGGSFESGSASLSDQARSIMARIAASSDRPDRRIIVTGHTDDVPVTGGAFDDNFDLAAARAASVVHELIAQGTVDPARISAVSKGEFAPIADNTTEEGRAKNRRIEIEIAFGD